MAIQKGYPSHNSSVHIFPPSTRILSLPTRSSRLQQEYYPSRRVTCLVASTTSTARLGVSSQTLSTALAITIPTPQFSIPNHLTLDCPSPQNLENHIHTGNNPVGQRNSAPRVRMSWKRIFNTQFYNTSNWIYSFYWYLSRHVLTRRCGLIKAAQKADFISDLLADSKAHPWYRATIASIRG